MGRSRGLSCLASVYTGEESRRRFGILACRVFTRFSALLMESAAFAYTARRDRRDVTELLKKSHRIVNEATRAQEPGDDKTHGLTFDRSQINIEKLRNESEKKVKRMAATLQGIRAIIKEMLAETLMLNPQRTDYHKRYQEIVSDYNREKDPATMEETFAKLVDLVNSLGAEQCLHAPAVTAVHGGGEAADSEDGLSARLASVGERGVQGGRLSIEEQEVKSLSLTDAAGEFARTAPYNEQG